jgi:prevent-host-death family protein
MAWQVQEAKQKFSALVQKAIDEGPQVVTKHGEEVVVVVSKKEYDRLNGNGQPMDFKEFIRTWTGLDQLDLERQTDLPREIDL